MFVVSGGAKGVTAKCVIELAKMYRCQFLLLGRSSIEQPEPDWAQGQLNEADLKKAALTALSTNGGGKKMTPAELNKRVQAVLSRREIEQTVSQIEQAGGQAQYISVDVTNRESVQAALAPFIEQVTGLVHGAGVLADKPIERKTEQDFDRVYNTKVLGLHNLLACLPLEQLAQVVLFSSVAGFYGNVGQADYAIANEILNKTAHDLKRQQPTCRVVSIGWGPWDGGMVTPALKKSLAERNIEVIPLEVGTRTFVEEISQADRDVAQIVVGSAITPLAMPNQFGEGLTSFRARRTLLQATNPFLQDHVIGGTPVLPAACAAAWMVNLVEQRYPGYTFFKFNDFRVLKGVVFDGTQPTEFTVEGRELVKVAGDVIEVELKIWSRNEAGKMRYHYSGQVQVRTTLPEPPRYTEFNLIESSPLDGKAFYQDKRLFHGASFEGIERVLNLSDSRLTTCCCLPSVSNETQGQFPVQTVNPYILDVQLQGMLVWVQQILGQGCLPAQAALYEQFRPIPFDQPFYVSLVVRAHSKTSFTADLFAHDEAGWLYTRTSGMNVTISERLNTMFAA